MKLQKIYPSSEEGSKLQKKREETTLKQIRRGWRQRTTPMVLLGLNEYITANSREDKISGRASEQKEENEKDHESYQSWWNMNF